MYGYAWRNGVWQQSSDRLEVEQAMPQLKSKLELLAKELSDTEGEEELNKNIEEINYWLDVWNDNIAFLNSTTKQKVIAEARQVVAALKWPPQEPATA